MKYYKSFQSYTKAVKVHEQKKFRICNENSESPDLCLLDCCHSREHFLSYHALLKNINFLDKRLVAKNFKRLPVDVFD